MGRTLRERYILHYVSAYDHEAVDVDALVDMSDGTTPAFIKEWVHRSVQIATEGLDDEEAELALTTDDFEEAYAEMKRFTEGSTGRIAGFLGSDKR